MQTRSPALVALLAAALGACEKKPPPPPAAPPAPPVVTITATEYAFQAPDTITAGLTTIRLIPAGKELHHAVLIKIGEGKTLADFQQGMQEAMRSKGPMKPPPWISLAGGVNAAIGADTGEVTQVIEPGLYAMACFIPGRSEEHTSE